MGALTGHIIIACVQVAVCFLYVLNMFLRGAWKRTVESVLSFSIVFTVILAFALLGWQWGIAYAVLPFVFVGLSRPLAQRLARKMLGYRTGIDDASHYDVVSELQKGKDFEAVMEKLRRDREQVELRLKAIAERPAISAVLSTHGLSFDAYCNLFRRLRCSALHDLAWDILSSPADLIACIEMESAGKSESEIWAHFRGLD